MSYRPLQDVLPELARRETRTLVVASADPESPLPVGAYALEELYCEEVDCDCRRVFFCVQSSFRAGPEAVIAWGWESPAFYVKWLGEDDEATLDQLVGPALNLASPQGELAPALLEEVRKLLSWDTHYVDLIKEHYRLFRRQIRRPRSGASGAGAVRSQESRGTPAESGDLPVEGPEAIVKRLEEAGIDTTQAASLPGIALAIGDDSEVAPSGEELIVTDGERTVCVRPGAITELFRGRRRPPHFGARLPRAYVPFFAAIERTAYEYCVCADQRVRDKEFERAYNDLRRRPDGPGEHPVVRHLQASIRLYMSLREVSQLEFEAVLGRLSRSARTFAMGHTSANYLEHALCSMFAARS